MKARYLLLILALLTACQGGGEAPILAEPAAAAWTAATKFRDDVPSARVVFSQRTGELMWIDGGGKRLQANAGSELATVIAFFEHYPSLYRIDDPAQALRPGWVGLPGSMLVEPKVAPAERGSLRSYRFAQYANELPLRGHHGVAIYDAGGGLLALQTRLTPSANVTVPENRVGVASQNLTLSDEPTPMRSVRRALEILPGGSSRVVIESTERHSFGIRRTLRDEAGHLIESSDGMGSALAAPPEDWQNSGTLVSVGALDSSGKTASISSTRADARLVLGFRLPDIHAPGAAVSISDSGRLPNPAVVEKTPLATDAEDWLGEPEFATTLSDATGLATNLETTLRWFHDRLGWNSWDGQGSSLFAAIRVNKTLSGGLDVGAYGGAGYLMIGDGHTADGHPLSDALEIVAHEFTHSVIDATANFELVRESGTLNESLCDFFGMAVSNYTATVFGETIGLDVPRDLLNPASRGMPASYSDYDLDSRDLHDNVGIMNRALTTAALDGPDPLPVTTMIFDALRDVTFAPDTSLEEFAAVLSAYCGARGSDACAGLEMSFRDTELLRVFNEMQPSPRH